MNAPTPPAGQQQRLEHFPISFFAMVMGTTGLAIAWHKAHGVLGTPEMIGCGLTLWSAILFVLIAIGYAAKMSRHWEAVKHEFAHPIRVNFFPALSISLLLLAVAFTENQPGLASILWMIGAVVHLAFTLTIMSSWIHHTHYNIKHASPAWFIPVVGNIIVPIAGVRFAPADISWFFFSIGLVFWLVLMTIVLYRLFFHEPLPARLTPTLFILIAPPSVGFLAYVALTGQVDAFARVLYFTALFLTLLLASNAVRFFRLPFFISAWAYSFPLAAMTIATFEMSARSGQAFYAGLSWMMLAVLSGVVALLAFKTLRAASRGQICVPE